MKRLSLLLCLLAVTVLRAADQYPLGPDSQRQPGVPQGTITHYTWSSVEGRQTFPGTVRDYWVYIPAEYRPDKPACLMVFQDGEGFMKEDGRSRIPIVFDNLIARHDMPVTIGVFINPGVLKASSPDQQDRFNRSFEYDGMSDRYARFLLDEILPEVAKHYNLSSNPDDRAIAGLSSGGICAFTVAWNRPDQFHRVLSFIGSFTDLRGGDVYPSLIRKTEPKPLRVFLQDGNHDLNIYAGDWWMANQSMASSLEYAGYDVKFVTGDKDHDMEQGGAIMPDALRWLWRDYPQPIAKPAPNHGGDKRTAILDPGHDWQEVPLPRATGRGAVIDDGFNSIRGTWEAARDAAAGLTADAAGNVFLSDLPGQRILEIAPNGDVSTVTVYPPTKGSPYGSMGVEVGSDNLLYACVRDHVAAYRVDGRTSGRIIASGLHCHGLAVAQDGSLFVSDPHNGSIWRVDRSGRKKDESLPTTVLHANGIAISPDQSLLLVDEPDTRWVWSFQIQSDRSLANAEPFYHLDVLDDRSGTNAAGMTVDTQGSLYVATRLGIQVCDQPGRVVAIIDPPAPGPLLGVTFGGADFQDLYVVAGDKLYKRHLLRKGVPPGAPLKPPVPQL